MRGGGKRGNGESLVPNWIYHITDFSNLASIVGDGGVHCLGTLRKKGTKYVSMAHASIQERRARQRVPCGKCGVLHDYVPFYFAPRSPMLYAIHKGRVDGYPNGQKDVVYLIGSVESVSESGLPFVFTDHAIIDISRFFVDLENLGCLDWDIMEARYWRDTVEDMDRCRRRQAEFLVHSFFPWSLVLGIVVMRSSQVAAVEELIGSDAKTVKATPGWYY